MSSTPSKSKAQKVLKWVTLLTALMGMIPSLLEILNRPGETLAAAEFSYDPKTGRLNGEVQERLKARSLEELLSKASDSDILRVAQAN